MIYVTTNFNSFQFLSAKVSTYYLYYIEFIIIIIIIIIIVIYGIIKI